MNELEYLETVESHMKGAIPKRLETTVERARAAGKSPEVAAKEVQSLLDLELDMALTLNRR